MPHTFYMFKSSYRPVEVTARLYSENGSGTFFSGKGRTDAEAIGALICAAGANKFGIEFVLDSQGPGDSRAEDIQKAKFVGFDALTALAARRCGYQITRDGFLIHPDNVSEEESQELFNKEVDNILKMNSTGR